MLIGEHIRLRRAEPNDAQLIAGWWGDPAYRGEFYNVWPAAAHEWASELAKDVDNTREAFYLIVARDTDKPIGTCGYVPYTVGWPRGLELWYQVEPTARGQGVATQATCLLVNHLFGSTPVERLQAAVVVGNEASRHVAEGAGLRLEGVNRHLYFLNGEYRDMWLLSIVRSDWANEAAYRSARRPF